ncbi:MAG: glycosyltransferase [Paenibacillaceae bacterium]|nr:glycosyltransferase [Paenibacillaceae bacterium]
MRRRHKFLLLTAGFGDGHIKVAQALQQTIERQGDQAVVVDPYRESLPVWNELCRQLYRKSAAMAEIGFDYYGWSYYLTRDLSSDSPLFKWIGAFSVKTLAAIIERERPTAIVNTFPFGNIIDGLRERGVRLPNFTVITDYTLHNRWLHAGADHYYVASADLQRKLAERGVPLGRTTASGIPVRSQFERASQQAAVPATGSVLIMAGSYMTIARTVKLVSHLLRHPGLTVNLVCGRNKTLLQALAGRFFGIPEVTVYGYVDHLEQLMSRAACLVTKAGGVTLSEAVQLQVPVLIFNPLAGQEKENAAYLADKGAALVSHTVKQLAGQIRDLLLTPGLAGRMRRQAGLLRKPEVAATIVAHMRSQLEDVSQEQTAAVFATGGWRYHESVR